MEILSAPCAGPARRGGGAGSGQLMGARPAAAVDRPRDFSALMEITARPDLVFVRGRGLLALGRCRARRYLDFVQGWAVNCLGHSHPVIAQALARQSARLINASPSFFNDQA